MRLSIHSLQKTLFQGEAEKIIARTPMGEITVLDGHIPLVTPLTGLELRVVDKKGISDIITLVSGFLEVRPESEGVVLSKQ